MKTKSMNKNHVKPEKILVTLIRQLKEREKLRQRKRERERESQCKQ